MIEYLTLEQLGTVSRGRSRHRPRNDPKLYGGKYPFIQTANVKSANFYITSYNDSYNDVGLSQSKLWESGTLCITIAANIADTGVLAFPACFPDSILGFVPFENISDVRYIKYCFDLLQKDFKNISQGTAQDNLSLEKLLTIKFPVPLFSKQCRIAEILSAYDDLIENNQKQIKLLEEAAMLLYKEWFVKLCFPGHENMEIVDGLPEGWRNCHLSEIAQVNATTITKDYPHTNINYVDIGSVRAGNIEVRTAYALTNAPGRAKRIAMDGDIIWGMVRPNLKAYALVLEPMPNDIFSTGFAVITADSVPFSFLYCVVIQDAFVSYLVNCTNGAAYPAVKPIHFEDAKIIVPTNDLLTAFNEKTEPMYRRAHILRQQIDQAKNARDKLLPKLMNGEIEV